MLENEDEVKDAEKEILTDKEEKRRRKKRKMVYEGLLGWWGEKMGVVEGKVGVVEDMATMMNKHLNNSLHLFSELDKVMEGRGGGGGGVRKKNKEKKLGGGVKRRS